VACQQWEGNEMPPDYFQLQQWAKENGVKANQKKAVLQRLFDKAQKLTAKHQSKAQAWAAAQMAKAGTYGERLERRQRSDRVRTPQRARNPQVGLKGFLPPPQQGPILGPHPFIGPQPMAGAQTAAPAATVAGQGQWSPGRGERTIPRGANWDSPTIEKRTKTRWWQKKGKPNEVRRPIGTYPGAPSGGVDPSKTLVPYDPKVAAKNAKGALKWTRFLGPAANTLFLGLMLYDIMRRGGGFGARSEQQRNALAVMQGGLVPGMQQRSAVSNDISRMQLGVDEMERLGSFARYKKQGMGQAQNFMSEQLDNIVATKQSRLARASFMPPDVQDHLANLVNTGTF